jgi:hypothetical protein
LTTFGDLLALDGKWLLIRRARSFRPGTSYERLEMRNVVGRIAGTRTAGLGSMDAGRASNSADVAAATAIRGYRAGLYRWEQRRTGDLEPAD